MNVIQRLYGQFFGFYFFTLFIKTCKVLFNSSDSRGQILAPKFDSLFQAMLFSFFLKQYGYRC